MGASSSPAAALVIQLLLMCLGKQQVMAQVLVFWSPTGETWIEFQALAVVVIWGADQQMEISVYPACFL